MKVQCHNCGGVIAVDDEDRGTPVRCGHCGKITVIPPSRIYPRVLIDDFVLRDTIGTGGMGTVYRALQLSLDRDVALKVLRFEYAENSKFVLDFVREARNAAMLNHPNIIPAYAVGEDDGLYFIAMELIEGRTVKDMLEYQQQLDIDWSVNCMIEVAEALDHAWTNHQLVHRDIKPDNIMVRDHDGAIKLADLGLAKPGQELLGTATGVVGTVQYVCPDTLLGDPVDIQDDIYSLGATFYHIVTGQVPFVADNSSDIARQHIEAPLQPPKALRPELSDSLNAIIERMMAKWREERYPDPRALIDDLRKVQDGIDITAPEAAQARPRKKKKDGEHSKSSAKKTGIRRRQGEAGKKTGVRRRQGETTVHKRPRTTAVSVGTVHDAMRGAPPPPRKDSKGRTLLTAFILSFIVVAIAAILFAAHKSEADAKKKRRAAPATMDAGERTQRLETLVKMLSQARDYESKNPQDVAGQVARYQKIRDLGEGTEFAAMAERELTRLKRKQRNP